MRKYINRQDRRLSDIGIKMLVNPFFCVVAIIIVLCSCTEPGIAELKDEQKTLKNDSTVVKDSIAEFEPGNSKDVILTGEVDGQ